MPKGAALPLRRDAPLRGIGLVLVTGIFFNAADVVSKLLTAEMSPLQVIWLRYGTFTAIMLALVWRTGGRSRLLTQRPWLQVLRGLGVTVSSILFVMGLQHLPIADATASSFVAPLFVTALSIPMLGETIGWRRWTATLVGLIGVLIVVRPGGSGFQTASLLPVASALSWAFAMIITRMMSRTESPLTTLAYSAIIGFAVSSLWVPFVWQPLTWTFLLMGLFIGVSSTVGHWLLVSAFRFADASLLAPFSYLQLLWASILGYWIFAALPDLWTLVGAVVIAASGLYTAHRERIRARQILG
ncbi:DMT family transporter [Bosea sp. PAMC 26642]|uniref:DMT family transporter n=1 Tax=Bosea sp. (strain PAMC 26642) TaxID=1792307 RepID=UPI0012E854A1|nr:DMT family transporter [Bosea sp. PAMC 26642]